MRPGVPFYGTAATTDRMIEYLKKRVTMKHLVLILAALAACIQAGALPATYRNPIIEESVPDPTVIRAEDGFYYLAGTEDIWNVPVFRSSNLVDWTQTGTVFDSTSRPERGQVWAPEFCRINGKYVMFYSVNIPEEDTYAMYLGYAVADHPAGPWTNRGKLFDGHDAGCRNTIDPFCFQDDGKYYLFWGSTTNMWAMEIYIDENLNITFDLSEKVQTAGENVEGTEIYKRDGWYYMFASIGSYAWTTYRVAVGRSKNVFGPYVDRNGVSFLQGGNALDSSNTLTSNNYKFTGNGHNAPIVTDGEGNTWFICHGHVKNQDFEKRMPLLDRLYWDEDGWPYLKTGSPTHAETEAPRFPSEWTVADPSTSAMSASRGYYDVFQMSAAPLESLRSLPGNEVAFYAPEEDGRTITRLLMRKYTPRPLPGVDGGEDYQSYFVTGSGPGSITYSTGAAGLDLSHITADTHLRIALRTDSEPELFGMDFFGGAFSCSVSGYGTGYPLLAHWPVGNGWIGLDIPLGRIQEFCPGFSLASLADGKWTGDYLKINAGRLKDSNFSIDAFYLFTPAETGGVESVADDGMVPAISFDGFVLSSVRDGIGVCSLSGETLLESPGRSLDVASLQPGIYVARSGTDALKIVVRR